MSELPRTEDPPQSNADAGEQVDPARVEEAFAAFADRVRELESVAGELRAELGSLRAERAAPATRFDHERWPFEPGANPSPDWIAAVPTPLPRGLVVPRLALEGAFLLLVALFAGLADLPVVWIVIVMVAAWTLVVLSEWAAAAKRARWRLDEIAPPLDAGAAETTGPWNMPVVQATVVEAAEPESTTPAAASKTADPESKTIVTKLPPEAEAAEAEPDAEDAAQPGSAPEQESAPEPEPKRRRGLRRRKQAAEAGAPDPWEA